ncbi:hypothetical protein VP1G_10091 [Cytospora mali]|uniref:Uncharacterized protein n=1 Tax=Cytospora mali TaxID=578113 RepID=A0A194VGS1_CYTMA|nr:hypothetical protein VP1G_10091 [Valsa mali var. pyri (nom. inval.)]
MATQGDSDPTSPVAAGLAVADPAPGQCTINNRDSAANNATMETDHASEVDAEMAVTNEHKVSPRENDQEEEVVLLTMGTAQENNQDRLSQKKYVRFTAMRQDEQYADNSTGKPSPLNKAQKRKAVPAQLDAPGDDNAVHPRRQGPSHPEGPGPVWHLPDSYHPGSYRPGDYHQGPFHPGAYVPGSHAQPSYPPGGYYPRSYVSGGAPGSFPFGPDGQGGAPGRFHTGSYAQVSQFRNVQIQDFQQQQSIVQDLQQQQPTVRDLHQQQLVLQGSQLHDLQQQQSMLQNQLQDLQRQLSVYQNQLQDVQRQQLLFRRQPQDPQPLSSHRPASYAPVVSVPVPAPSTQARPPPYMRPRPAPKSPSRATNGRPSHSFLRDPRTGRPINLGMIHRRVKADPQATEEEDSS